MADYTYGGLAPEHVQGIRDFEGYRDAGYGDYKQRSIGYGSKEEVPGERIDKAEAERRLDRDLTEASNSVKGMGVEMTPGQHAGLTSLTYNAGPGWQKAGLGDAVRSGDWDAVAQHHAQYNKAGGAQNQALVDRRAKEGAWMAGDGGDLPTGATQTSGVAPGALSGGVSTAMPPDTRRNPDPGILSSASTAGGPGILSAIGNVLNGRQSDGTPGGYNFAKAMTGAGNALQSINNPAAAAAAEAAQSKAAQDNFSIHVDKDGKIFRLRKNDGNVTMIAGTGTQYDAVKPELLKQVDEEAKAVAHTHNTAKQAQIYLDAIKNGTLDTSIFGQGKAAWDSAFGKGSKQAELYNGFDAWRTQMANDQLLLNKGVQTDKDYVRAKEGLMTGLGRNDKTTVINALENGIQRMHEVGVKPYGNLIDAATRGAGSRADPETFSGYRKQYDAANDWYGKRSVAAPVASATTPPANRPPIASFNR